MTILYILIGVVVWCWFWDNVVKRSDRKTMARLKDYLIVAPKENPEVHMFHLDGYGGGCAEFSSGKKFYFHTDEGLFQADNIIEECTSFRIVSRERG